MPGSGHNPVMTGDYGLDVVLGSTESLELVAKLKARFEGNMHRHAGIEWQTVVTRLRAGSDQIWRLRSMEMSGGEPDVVVLDSDSTDIFFVDCSKESPAGRRSLCYDQAALDARKENKPKHSAMGMAMDMGIEVLDEHLYASLQAIETFDTKTSSWLKTPSDVREKGGAIFGDWRFGRTFIYHNGADSYYGSRGFRGFLRV
jgi:hypothetical protein